MQKIVTWLNKRNIEYRNSQGKPFRGFFCRSKKKDNKFYWNGISDNCAHPVVNSLASIGILKKKKINQIFFKQLANIAIPANTLLNIHQKTNLDPILVDHYFSDPIKRELFEKFK